MALYVNSSVGLQISRELSDDEEAWSQHLDYSDYFPDNTILRPVTYSCEQDTFYAATFGLDGRISSIADQLSDYTNANRSDAYGYYVKFTFYARTDEDVSVELSRAYENTGTYLIGTPVWNDDEVIHNDGGKGAQSAIRVGFKITKFDENGEQTGDPDFIVYEPNCNNHLDYSSGYYATASIDGTETLVPTNKLIRQTSTAWLEMNPVQKDIVVYNYGNFLDDPHLFDLDKDCTAQIDIYIWLEGQDVDCTNEIGKEAKIFTSIQFHSETRVNTGMEDIE